MDEYVFKSDGHNGKLFYFILSIEGGGWVLYGHLKFKNGDHEVNIYLPNGLLSVLNWLISFFMDADGILVITVGCSRDLVSIF